MSVEVLAQENTILIVDDTPTNLQVLFELLSEQGYEVSIAKSGENALQRLTMIQPSLILLDVMMPGIDGFETCQRIKANPKICEIPIIFMTALSDPIDKVKGLTLGAVDYITKPIQHQETLARIQVHLQLRQRTLELDRALTALKNSQIHLIQGEKMAALGQLVAGVAHEINNPINFIHGNLNHAKAYVQDLLNYVQLHEQEPPPLAKIQQLAEEIDLEFLQADLLKLLESMSLGTDRIRDLVLSLRNFSRHDEAECKRVNLHDGIESTLVILQHRLKAKSGLPTIQLIRDYAPLPEIQCYPSQFNQVLMNLFSNAIDALESAAIKSPTITIRTTQTAADWIEISIADNGDGIPESIQARLFDPFFTTKPVGKGTGLGLSISHQIIVEKHHGKILCQSAEGQGTEFIVQIPVKIQP